MKKTVILTICLFMFFLVACSYQPDVEATVGLPETGSITFLDDGIWPDNKYTKDIPVPPGSIGWSMLDAANNSCAVSIRDLEESDFQDYFELLNDQGFVTISEVSEEIETEGYISYGLILTNRITWINLVYENGTLVMRMTDQANG